MKSAFLFLALALSLLAGCGTTGGTSDPESYVATSCAAATAAMVVITEAVDQDRLDREQRDKVRQAQTVLRPICKSPDTPLSVDAEAAFGQAVADIALAHAKARSSE